MSSVFTILGRVGGALKVPRKTHAEKDVAATEAFRSSLADQLATASQGARTLRLRVLDEHCYGLLPVTIITLPPYSPELNPVEKHGDLIKDAICNQLFGKLATLDAP